MGKQAKLKRIRRDRKEITQIIEEGMDSGKIIQHEGGNIKTVDSKIMGDVFCSLWFALCVYWGKGSRGAFLVGRYVAPGWV